MRSKLTWTAREMGQIERHCPLHGTGTMLVLRLNGQTGEVFLACPHWPGCTYTEGMPESVRLRLMGVPALPGME